MDPTAPNNPNNLNPQDPPSPPGPAKNPIQPGQFVVAGEQPADIFKQPSNTAGIPPLQPPASQIGQQPAPQFQPPSAPQPIPSPQPAMHIAQTPSEPIAPTFPDNQPNPTPFVPPGAAPPALEDSKGSGIKKLRTLAIILAILILIGVVAALAWFLFLGKPKDKPAANTTQDLQVEQSSPPPKRTSGGFSEFPAPLPATSGAQQATPSATPI